MWPVRITDQKEESKDIVSQTTIMGIYISRDWLNVHCSLSNQRRRLPNTDEGLEQLIEMAFYERALVCLEATGARERRLWAALDTAGMATWHLPPAQIKAFAARRGMWANTDRIAAEVIARFMAFKSDAGRSLPYEKIRPLRALTSKRSQFVETRKRLLAQIKAHKKLGSADLCESMDCKLKGLLHHQIAEFEMQIEQVIVAHEKLKAIADIVRSVPRIGLVASTMLFAEMPELRQIMSKRAAALTRLSAITHDSGAMRGKAHHWQRSAITLACNVPASRVASHRAPDLKVFADRLCAASEPQKSSSLRSRESLSQSQTRSSNQGTNGVLRRLKKYSC